MRPRPSNGMTLASVAVGLAVGAAVGIGGYTFVYAKGYSYLLNDPAACNNCHVMNDHFDGWTKSSHHAVATCNDCHTPHDFVGKYWTKAENGFFHALAFTTGNFPEPIRARGRNREVSEEACRRCHGPIVAQMTTGHEEAGQELSCVRCHGAVGHPNLKAPSSPGAIR
jgi:cytochrome c nitrite reductase small subunit